MFSWLAPVGKVARWVNYTPCLKSWAIPFSIEHKSGALQVDSIFLGTLYRAIKQYGAETDLLSLLTRTQNAVSQITGNHGFVKVKDAQGKDTIEERSVVTIEEPAAKKFKVEPGVDYSKQMPNFYSTLTKSVMLPVGK